MTKEEFNKVWKDTSREGILNQFYYDYRYMQKLKEDINKAIGNWNTLKRHFEFLKINTTGGNKEFMEDILELMNILEGGENNR